MYVSVVISVVVLFSCPQIFFLWLVTLEYVMSFNKEGKMVKNFQGMCTASFPVCTAN